MQPQPQHQHPLPLTALDLVLLKASVTGDLPWGPRCLSVGGEGREIEYQAAKTRQMQRNMVRIVGQASFFPPIPKSLQIRTDQREGMYKKFILEGLYIPSIVQN